MSIKITPQSLAEMPPRMREQIMREQIARASLKQLQIPVLTTGDKLPQTFGLMNPSSLKERLLAAAQPKKKNRTTETKLLWEITDWLLWKGYLPVRVTNVRPAMSNGQIRFVPIPKHQKGCADLLVCVRGKFVAIEVKATTKKGIQSADQKNWQAALERAGGKYILADDLGKFTDDFDTN